MDFEPLIERIIQIASESLPRLAGAGIALLLGWIFGRLLGKAFSGLVRRLGIEESFNKTTLGRALKRTNLSLSSIVDVLTRWFIYLAAILLASDIVGAGVFSSFIRGVIEYIPYLIAGFIILTLGFIITDFIGNAVSALGDELGLAFSGALTLFMKIFLGFTVVIIALTVMKVDVSIFYVFANALAWGIAGGLAVGLGIALGWGFKDLVAKNAEGIVKNLGITFSKVRETATTEALKERVARLEEELKAQRERVEAARRREEALLEEALRPIANLDERLAELIDNTGKVSSVADGYEIEVIDPISFPWCSVVLTLQNQGFDVWFSKKGDKHLIMAKMRV